MSIVAARVRKAGEGQRQAARLVQREAEAPPVGEIGLRLREHGVRRAHATLPGQGNATAERRVTSTRV